MTVYELWGKWMHRQTPKFLTDVLMPLKDPQDIWGVDSPQFTTTCGKHMI